MKIILFGVSNVGKTTIAKIMSEELKIGFYDIDEEIKKEYNITLEEFVNSDTLAIRDEKRSRLLARLIDNNNDSVIAVTPLSEAKYYYDFLKRDDCFFIYLEDDAENIFKRLVFSDVNDIIYHDDEYKNRYKKHYVREIEEDLRYYGMVYRYIPNIYNIDGANARVATKKIIRKYGLNKLI